MRQAEPRTAESAPGSRRSEILEAAVGVFGRYGFKKASMDDIARAAGISRQGLYLHFATKEHVFQEAVVHVVSGLKAAVFDALASEGSIAERLLRAFECVHGHAAGEIHKEHWTEILTAADALAGSSLVEMDQAIVKRMALALSESGLAKRWKACGVGAKDLAEHLFATSYGLKHRVRSPAEYRAGIERAIKIIGCP